MQSSVKIAIISGTILATFQCIQSGCSTAHTISSRAYPACVDSLIAQLKLDEITYPPSAVYQYTYKKQRVFFVPAPCCDFFSILYNDSCQVIAHPDGGITGRGDGRAVDFFESRTAEIKIWEDDRKP